MDAEAESRLQERVGSVLNEKWTLERLLGAGGMAAVYSARHRNGARAAVKMLHPELTRHEQVSERFLREGYAANKVEHRGTVQVLDDDVVKEGPDAGAAYIVMELLDGEAVDERAHKDPPLTEREVLEIVASVLDVLICAHERGVVHRDLKPENLFLARDPDTGTTRVKVLDFGLARLTEAAPVTVHGLAIGTPHFMPPEQAAGNRDEIDGRTDIFALGATAYFLLSGQYVHDGENILQVVVKMGKDPAPSLRTVAPQVSELAVRLVDRALQFRREDRYQTATDMRADVDEALRALGDAPSSIEPYAPSKRKPLDDAFPPLPPRPHDAETVSAGRRLANAEGNVSPSPAPGPVKEPTTELSVQDLEPAEVAAIEAAAKSEIEPKSAPKPPPVPSSPSEPLALTRRRSKLPLIFLTLLAAGGVFAWLKWSEEIRARLEVLQAMARPQVTADGGAVTLTGSAGTDSTAAPPPSAIEIPVITTPEAGTAEDDAGAVAVDPTSTLDAGSDDDDDDDDAGTNARDAGSPLSAHAPHSKPPGKKPKKSTKGKPKHH